LHFAARKLVAPIDRFLSVSAASGIVLMLAAVVAMVWANSPWQDSYHAFWHTKVTLGVGEWRATPTLHFLVNDVLMVVFFFVVGLEIKREIWGGELRDLRRATLPIAAALGGMVVPAAIYLAIAGDAPGGSHGWGVPMATDIAFAVGVLTLLGPRVPPALRVLLLALAIIDDLGAILVIALFYSEGLRPVGLWIALAGVFGVRLFKWLALRNPWLYLVPGAVIWGGVLSAGIHPTIAGVVLGLLTPMMSWFGRHGFLAAAQAALDDADKHLDDRHEFVAALTRIDLARREAISPGERLEHALHPWVAFGVMPIFALANAGVSLDTLDLGAPGAVAILAGILAGLVVGKMLGVFGVAWLATRLRIAVLPAGSGARGLLVVGSVAGIGFTMSLFIASLAFTDPATLGVARLGILIASVLAATLGLVVGRMLLRG
jgi:NhaA family Na+:H+ antiporter